MEINAYEEFHIFACMSVVKTYVTGSVLKDKKHSALKIFFIFFANCFNVLLIIQQNPYKNPKTLEVVNSLGYFLHNLNPLILQMIVVL